MRTLEARSLPGSLGEDYFRHLVEEVKDYAILMLDPEGFIASWNAGAERITGYGADEIVGQQFSVFYREQDRRQGKPRRELEEADAHGRFEEEGWRVRKDGSQFWANVVVTPLRNQEGELYGFAKITRDITDRKLAEERIQRLNQDLAFQLSQLTTANDELEQRHKENETFVYSVSHDLRSPLVNLQGFGQELKLLCDDLRDLLSADSVPEEVRTRATALLDDEMGEAVHFIQTAVLRLSNIIDALLRLSRAGRVEYRQQQLDLQDMVGKITDSLRGTIAERNATVTVGELPPACGDAAAIEQVFANLLGNALKYLGPNPTGEIEVGFLSPSADAGQERDQRDGFRTYFVRDNGLGIAKPYQAKAFQAFQRLHPEQAPGEGMGLSIVRRIVERHGGRVWVESTVGVGSTFFVSLPRAGYQPASRRARETKDGYPLLAQERINEHDSATVGDCVGGR